MASEGLRAPCSEAMPLVKSARVAAEQNRRRLWLGGDQLPCHSAVAARLVCSPIAKHVAGAAMPVASAEPVSMMQNLSGDLLDGGAELNHLNGDAGDRAGSLDDDVQCAAGAARSALALLAPPCGGGWVGWVWDGLLRDRAAQGDA